MADLDPAKIKAFQLAFGIAQPQESGIPMPVPQQPAGPSAWEMIMGKLTGAPPAAQVPNLDQSKLRQFQKSLGY